MLQHQPWTLTLSPFNGVGNSMFAAMPILALLGIRYPLKMLPLLLFEISWKAIWLAMVAVPLWLSHSPIDPNVSQTITACLMVVIYPIIMPWRYVFTTFAFQAGDRWR